MVQDGYKINIGLNFEDVNKYCMPNNKQSETKLHNENVKKKNLQIAQM